MGMATMGRIELSRLLATRRRDQGRQLARAIACNAGHAAEGLKRHFRLKCHDAT